MEKIRIATAIELLGKGSIQTSDCLDAVFEIFDEKEEELQKLERAMEALQDKYEKLDEKMKGFC